MYWFPKTKIGKISFWSVITGFLIIVILNVIADATQCSNGICHSNPNELWVSFTIVLSWLAILSVVLGGITSIIAITKHKDRAILLFVPALIGCLGLFFLLGEFLVPH